MPTGETVSRFDENDRADVLALLGGDERTLDSPNHRVHVAKDGGQVIGAVLWLRPDAIGETMLGAVTLSPGSEGNRPLFYKLIAACIQDAVDEGFQKGYATIRDAGMVALLDRDFDITVTESAWEPNTRTAVQWEIHVDLADVLAQLQRFL